MKRFTKTQKHTRERRKEDLSLADKNNVQLVSWSLFQFPVSLMKASSRFLHPEKDTTSSIVPLQATMPFVMMYTLLHRFWASSMWWVERMMVLVFASSTICLRMSAFWTGSSPEENSSITMTFVFLQIDFARLTLCRNPRDNFDTLSRKTSLRAQISTALSTIPAAYRLYCFDRIVNKKSVHHRKLFLLCRIPHGYLH